jgi:hypothetical protein
MARGNSGRIVLEIDPKIKDRLYEVLSKRNVTLKDWFLLQCNSYLSDPMQPELFPEPGSENIGSHIKDGAKR